MLVEWLTEREFADPPGSTLGAVVEATDIDPIQAAKLLSEWRGEVFEGRISAVMGDHEVRIEALEETTDALKHASVFTLESKAYYFHNPTHWLD